jgi:hypothetical protein
VKQGEINFGRVFRVDDEYKSAHRATEDTIDAIGLIVAAGACGMDAPDLSKTFAPNSGRHLRLRTVMGIGAVAPSDARRAILMPIARLFGFDIQVAKPMDDKEARIRLEEGLKQLGPVGEAKLAEIYGR